MPNPDVISPPDSIANNNSNCGGGTRLCSANGNVTFQTGASGMSVFGYIVPYVGGNPGPAPTLKAVQENGVQQSLVGSGPWNLDKQLNSAVVGGNTFYAGSAYSIIDLMSGKTTRLGDGPTAVNFTAVSNPCGILTEETAAEASKTPAILGGPSGIEPISQDGDWFYYGNISPDAPGRGSKLMLNGEPLSAELIAVAAADVYWWDWHGQKGTRHLVDRAFGDPNPGSVGVLNTSLKYPDVNQNGITLNNLAKFPDDSAFIVAHAVTSECRDNANLFVVDPDYSIFVQVNFNLVDSTGRSGSYGLWVKVIEPY